MGNSTVTYIAKPIKLTQYQKQMYRWYEEMLEEYMSWIRIMDKYIEDTDAPIEVRKAFFRILHERPSSFYA